MFSKISMKKAARAGVLIGIAKREFVANWISFQEAECVANTDFVIRPRQQSWPVEVGPNAYEEVCARSASLRLCVLRRRALFLCLGL